ncbi:MAG: hypothetical protein F6J98_24260 [Moorea sp. SIO4G2]|nr:hypothetical protein [Moorena sp. SIO4G2]
MPLASCLLPLPSYLFPAPCSLLPKTQDESTSNVAENCYILNAVLETPL